MSHRTPSPVEVVATIPGVSGGELISRFGLRSTLGVLTELLASAKDRVVIAAPFIQGMEGLHAGPVGMALVAALRRGVRVDVISTGAGLGALDRELLSGIAGAVLKTYRPRRNVDDPRVLGSHAKVVVSDGSDAYVGSANITQKGIGGNLEIGVLLHGSAAREVAQLIQALMESDYFVEWGSET